VTGQDADVLSVGYWPATAQLQARSFATMTQKLFFVDRTSGLVSKIQYTNYAENDPNSTETIEVYFSNYQTVSGISVPSHQSMYTDGALDTDIDFTSVSFDVGLTDAEFALPEVANAQ
jgi:hypothetical protein